jgi:hypothetical protein
MPSAALDAVGTQAFPGSEAIRKDCLKNTLVFTPVRAICPLVIGFVTQGD